ncbi:MAG: phospholipase D/Transphosphatidylase [Herminiimonas sp.]|nr:phospholipase D/Transphosphatidylase [Herminiimonas sp.]MDB5854261.1 phospholipase D/Transphosphatidylase [Herminiimonas sp.]
MVFSYFNILALLSIAVVAALTFVVLFEPGLDYRISVPLPAPDSEEFFRVLSAVVDEPALQIVDHEVLTDGLAFYDAQLEAIRGAQSTVHLEAFIFHTTPIGDRFLEALTERAAAGVKVRVVVDAVGSMLTRDRYFAGLRKAGGEVAWYQPFRWYTLKRLNNRTHRELMVVDGKTGFIGGAGIGTAWAEGERGQRPWRDTVVRLSGPIAAALQTAFVENWLEAAGEILTDRVVYPAQNTHLQATVMHEKLSIVVASAPSAGRATRARILFQMVLGAARSSICINSPYFLPDRALRRELLRAVERGVKVTVVVPGVHNNHLMTRIASRRHYGELLEGGVAIHEYEPGMIHAKILIVDALWSVIGSTNFDNRSFGLNDEVNLAAMDRDLAQRLMVDFENDLRRSRRVELAEWQRRSLGERALATVGVLVERQQ